MALSVADAESNVAIGLARLGHSVSWVGVVGADELGALVLRTLRAEGVTLQAARVDPDRPTGVMVTGIPVSLDVNFPAPAVDGERGRGVSAPLGAPRAPADRLRGRAASGDAGSRSVPERQAALDALLPLPEIGGPIGYSGE